jgi:hypothetical protein
MKLNCFLICDDIRNELGNKQSLIGVYDDVISFSAPQPNVGKWPKVIKLGIYIKLEFENEAEKAGFQRIKLEYSINNETVVLLDDSRPASLITVPRGINIGIVVNQFVIECSGQLNFQCIIYDKDNSIIYDFDKKITVQEEIVKQNNFA